MSDRQPSSREFDAGLPPVSIEPRSREQFFRAELQLHWTFLIMGALVILMSILMRSDGPTAVYLPGFETPMPETCSTKRLLGFACPGCGMTRAFIAISHFEFARAWGFNRASFVVYAFIAGQIPWHVWQISRIKRGLPPAHVVWVYALPIAMLIALLGNWLLNLSGR